MNFTHELKTDPKVFDAVWRGIKTYEIRKNDRGFAIGDTLILRETEYSGEAILNEGMPLEYTGRRIECRVTHILENEYGLKSGWAILSINVEDRQCRCSM